MKVPATQIVQFAFKELGMMVTVNQRLDFDQIELIASEFGFQAVREEEYAAEAASRGAARAGRARRGRRWSPSWATWTTARPRCSTTSARPTSSPARPGGITQHIGAYHVTLRGGKAITFLDTPGHQAFTAMRARGAQVTDIVVLVVAADDQVMPQTIEAISHAKNAGVPMIVAINKIDLPAANVAKVKQDLLQHNVVLEEFGGNVLSAEISAKKGTGIDHLLEQMLLQAEILDLKANPSGRAHGTVLEATLDPGKGPLATVLVQKGTLHGRRQLHLRQVLRPGARALDERGQDGEGGRPLDPGADPRLRGRALGRRLVRGGRRCGRGARDRPEAPAAGARGAEPSHAARARTLEDFSRALKEGEVTQLRIIIKADQGGPAEALADALAQLCTGEVRVDVVHRGVGAITESDVLLAKASGAIILGFHVRPDSTPARRPSASRSTCGPTASSTRRWKTSANALEGLLKPEEKETVLGEAEVLQLFKVSKVGTIAGCSVRSGTIQRTAKARVIRDGIVVYTGDVSSLKRFKDDVKEVREGLECGIGIENFNDLKVGDRIESFRMEEVKRTLQPEAAASR